MNTPTESEDWAQCEFCRDVQRVDDAINEGWIAYFYKGDIEFGAACPRCAEQFLQLASDGEYELS